MLQCLLFLHQELFGKKKSTQAARATYRCTSDNMQAAGSRYRGTCGNIQMPALSSITRLCQHLPTFHKKKTQQHKNMPILDLLFQLFVQNPFGVSSGHSIMHSTNCCLTSSWKSLGSSSLLSIAVSVLLPPKRLLMVLPSSETMTSQALSAAGIHTTREQKVKGQRKGVKVNRSGSLGTY